MECSQSLLIQTVHSLIKYQEKKLSSEHYYWQSTKIVPDLKGLKFNVVEADMAYNPPPPAKTPTNHAESTS